MRSHPSVRESATRSGSAAPQVGWDDDPPDRVPPSAEGAAAPTRERPESLTTFTADAAAELAGPAWLRQRRAASFEVLEAMPLPTEKEEVWRYSPIDELALDRFTPAGPIAAADRAASALVADLGRDLGDHGPVVTVVGGQVAVSGPMPAGLTVQRAADESDRRAQDVVGSVLVGGDALVRLNDAFCPDVVVVEVAPGAAVERPLVIVHWCPTGSAGGGPAPAAFPRTALRVGRGAHLQVVEVVAGPAAGDSLVVPVVECAVDDGAMLAYVSLQVLGASAWHIGRLSAEVGRDASLRVFTAGLGGHYDRLRTDVAVVGQGGSSELRSAYLGTGSQIHDVRTQQDHAAPRTTSDLLCKGAVAGASRSVYSGLIRIRHGAVRAEARQTNHNLVLDESAHADSVPNLDIEENDVRCSHASTVGPVDEDQRYYLESRGIPPDRAEQLIVLGFFDDIVDQVPVPAAAGRLRAAVGHRLSEALGISPAAADGPTAASGG